jgi:hypothetical protein
MQQEEDRMDREDFLEAERERNEILQRLTAIEHSMTELVDLYQSMKGAMKVLSWAERASVWFAKIAAAAAIVWSLWPGGKQQ